MKRFAWCANCHKQMLFLQDRTKDLCMHQKHKSCHIIFISERDNSAQRMFLKVCYQNQLSSSFHLIVPHYKLCLCANSKVIKFESKIN
jgi:hypothetical protein